MAKGKIVTKIISKIQQQQNNIDQQADEITLGIIESLNKEIQKQLSFRHSIISRLSLPFHIFQDIPDVLRASYPISGLSNIIAYLSIYIILKTLNYRDADHPPFYQKLTNDILQFISIEEIELNINKYLNSENYIQYQDSLINLRDTIYSITRQLTKYLVNIAVNITLNQSATYLFNHSMIEKILQRYYPDYAFHALATTQHSSQHQRLQTQTRANIQVFALRRRLAKIKSTRNKIGRYILLFCLGASMALLVNAIDPLTIFVLFMLFSADIKNTLRSELRRAAQYCLGHNDINDWLNLMVADLNPLIESEHLTLKKEDIGSNYRITIEFDEDYVELAIVLRNIILKLLQKTKIVINEIHLEEYEFHIDKNQNINYDLEPFIKNISELYANAKAGLSLVDDVLQTLNETLPKFTSMELIWRFADFDHCFHVEVCLDLNHYPQWLRNPLINAYIEYFPNVSRLQDNKLFIIVDGKITQIEGLDVLSNKLEKTLLLNIVQETKRKQDYQPGFFNTSAKKNNISKRAKTRCDEEIKKKAESIGIIDSPSIEDNIISLLAFPIANNCIVKIKQLIETYACFRMDVEQFEGDKRAYDNFYQIFEQANFYHGVGQGRQGIVYRKRQYVDERRNLHQSSYAIKSQSSIYGDARAYGRTIYPYENETNPQLSRIRLIIFEVYAPHSHNNKLITRIESSSRLRCHR